MTRLPTPAGPEAARRADSASTFSIPPSGTPTTRPGGMIAFESSVLDVPAELPPLDATRDAVLPLQIYFINVGQGDCTMVIAPNGKRLLIDCGTSGGGIDRQAVRDYVVSLLDPQDPRVHAMVITHPDSDHYVMLEEVLANVPVDLVYTVGPAAEFTSDGTDEWLGNFGDGQYTILKREEFTSSTPTRLGSVDFGDVTCTSWRRTSQAASRPPTPEASS